MRKDGATWHDTRREMTRPPLKNKNPSLRTAGKRNVYSIHDIFVYISHDAEDFQGFSKVLLGLMTFADSQQLGWQAHAQARFKKARDLEALSALSERLWRCHLLRVTKSKETPARISSLRQGMCVPRSIGNCSSQRPQR